jgi:hypothetical protein
MKPDENEVSFARWLSRYMKQRGIEQQELREIWHLDKATISRRLSGQSRTTRADIAELDERWGEGGELLLRAGYVPDSAAAPKGRYLDEQWLKRRIEAVEALSVSPYASPQKTAEEISALIRYARSTSPIYDKAKRLKYELQLQIDLVDLQADANGVSGILI